MPFTVLDVNNFWSPSGGGVRRYHLEKMAWYERQSEARLVFLMQDSRTWTEDRGSVIIEHVEALRIPGKWEYRFLWKPWVVRRYIKKYNPQVVEVGSPYLLPDTVRLALWGLRKKPRVVGFWHADFPVTYIRRFFSYYNVLLAKILEFFAWIYARHAFTWMQGVQVSCCEVESRLRQKGIQRTRYMPLGVDTKLYNPARLDANLRSRLQAGNPHRLTIFFPHRFTEEKGVKTLIEAYPSLCKRLGHEPAVVFAGTGPDLDWVQTAVQKYPFVQYAGFIQSKEEMARYYASCDLGLALSGWETFGLSILESMACGQCLVGANTGAAAEHIQGAKCGICITPGVVDALVNAICTLIESGQMADSRKRARLYAEAFTWEACFSRQLDYYREI